VIAAPTAVPPPVALAAAPARLVLPASSRAVIRVANTGNLPLDVRVSRAGLSLGTEGRPAVGPRAAPAGWLFVSRTRFRIRGHTAVAVALRAGALRGARAGDHATLLLLSAVRPGRHTVAVALRVGVVVVLRAQGRVARRLELGAARVERRGGRRVLRLGVVNRGDLDEWFGRDRVRLTLRRAGRVVGRPAVLPRRLLARSRGVVVATLGGGLRGRYLLEVRFLRPRPGTPLVHRFYRIVL
jgi:hypothetical protein